MIYLDYNRFFPRISQYAGSSCEASVLSYLLNEDYDDWDDANCDIDGDHCKISIPPTPGFESGSNYQLPDGTPGRPSTIDYACDSRDGFLVTLESGLLPNVGSADRGDDVVQGVYKEALEEKNHKQDCVAHVLNKDGDAPAENRSCYNSK